MNQNVASLVDLADTVNADDYIGSVWTTCTDAIGHDFHQTG